MDVRHGIGILPTITTYWPIGSELISTPCVLLNIVITLVSYE